MSMIASVELHSIAVCKLHRQWTHTHTHTHQMSSQAQMKRYTRSVAMDKCGDVMSLPLRSSSSPVVDQHIFEPSRGGFWGSAREEGSRRHCSLVTPPVPPDVCHPSPPPPCRPSSSSRSLPHRCLGSRCDVLSCQLSPSVTQYRVIQQGWHWWVIAVSYVVLVFWHKQVMLYGLLWCLPCQCDDVLVVTLNGCTGLRWLKITRLRVNFYRLTGQRSKGSESSTGVMS